MSEPTVAGCTDACVVPEEAELVLVDADAVNGGLSGRHAAADTDWKLHAQILSYSRARGIYAGLELNGSVIKMDRESTREFYGKMQPFRTTLETVSSPQAAMPFLTSLSKWAKLASK